MQPELTESMNSATAVRDDGKPSSSVNLIRSFCWNGFLSLVASMLVLTSLTKDAYAGVVFTNWPVFSQTNGSWPMVITVQTVGSDFYGTTQKTLCRGLSRARLLQSPSAGFTIVMVRDVLSNQRWSHARKSLNQSAAFERGFYCSY
jgi:hypothetical protein